MVALDSNILDDIARDAAQADLDVCIAVRRTYRCRLLELERTGRMTRVWKAKLEQQIDRLTEWIDRYRERLA